jgi:hypothetical protein
MKNAIKILFKFIKLINYFLNLYYFNFNYKINLLIYKNFWNNYFEIFVSNEIKKTKKSFEKLRKNIYFVSYEELICFKCTINVLSFYLNSLHG